MTYQVLARRWRPQRFADVIGQEHITRTLQNAIAQNRLAHGFLFTGPRGVGKTSTARILARAINCERAGQISPAEPCNECETCRALLEDRELDVIEIDGATYRKIEDMRSIQESARLSPIAGSKKVIIIDEVHMLTKEAFNAFLKTLEEPPSHVIFILATTDVHKVPATIRSRVQRFDFRPLSAAEISQHLGYIAQAEGWKNEPEALYQIARAADGSLRDAEGLLDQVVAFCADVITLDETRKVLGALSHAVLERATKLIARQDLSGLPEFFDLLAKQGTDYSLLLRELQSYWTDGVFLLQGLTVPGRSQEECDALKASMGELQVEDMFRLIRLAATLEDDIKWSVSPRTRFEISLLRWVTLDRAVSIKQLLEQLSSGKTATESRPAATVTPQPVAPKAPVQKAVSAAPTPKPAAAITPPVAPPSRNSALTLDELNQSWQQICDALDKISSAAAAFAHNDWEIISLDASTLALRPKHSGKFHFEQLKMHAQSLEQAVMQVTGAKVKVSASQAAENPAPANKDPESPATEGKQKAPGDLFSNVMSQFGGEDVTSRMKRQGK